LPPLVAPRTDCICAFVYVTMLSQAQYLVMKGKM
jgi:hypothetical protein